MEIKFPIHEENLTAFTLMKGTLLNNLGNIGRYALFVNGKFESIFTYEETAIYYAWNKYSPITFKINTFKIVY